MFKEEVPKYAKNTSIYQMAIKISRDTIISVLATYRPLLHILCSTYAVLFYKLAIFYYKI